MEVISTSPYCSTVFHGSTRRNTNEWRSRGYGAASIAACQVIEHKACNLTIKGSGWNHYTSSLRRIQNEPEWIQDTNPPAHVARQARRPSLLFSLFPLSNIERESAQKMVFLQQSINHPLTPSSNCFPNWWESYKGCCFCNCLQFWSLFQKNIDKSKVYSTVFI